MTDGIRATIASENKRMADKALRVLAAAMRKYDSAPDDFSPEALEHDLIFIGLTGMIDPVRPEVKAAIEECRGAGITPVMITGDHKDTAVAIAVLHLSPRRAFCSPCLCRATLTLFVA